MGCKDNMRNLCFKIIILILITSCSHVGIYEELGTYFKNIFSEPDDLSFEEVNRVKFASIQMRIGNNPNTLIVSHQTHHLNYVTPT